MCCTWMHALRTHATYIILSAIKSMQPSILIRFYRFDSSFCHNHTSTHTHREVNRQREREDSNAEIDIKIEWTGNEAEQASDVLRTVEKRSPRKKKHDTVRRRDASNVILHSSAMSFASSFRNCFRLGGKKLLAVCISHLKSEHNVICNENKQSTVTTDGRETEREHRITSHEHCSGHLQNPQKLVHVHTVCMCVLAGVILRFVSSSGVRESYASALLCTRYKCKIFLIKYPCACFRMPFGSLPAMKSFDSDLCACFFSRFVHLFVDLCFLDFGCKNRNIREILNWNFYRSHSRCLAQKWAKSINLPCCHCSCASVCVCVWCHFVGHMRSCAENITNSMHGTPNVLWPVPNFSILFHLRISVMLTRPFRDRCASVLCIGNQLKADWLIRAVCGSVCTINSAEIWFISSKTKSKC